MNRDITYIVTGCTGYVGNVLTKKLIAEGCRVVGFARSREKFERVFEDRAPEAVYGRAVGYISPNYPNEREKRRNNRIDFIKYLLYNIAAALVVIPILIVVMTQGYFTLTGTATKILFAAALLFWKGGLGCAAYLSRRDQRRFKENSLGCSPRSWVIFCISYKRLDAGEIL